ncbi:uncharacterized protein SCHCODRAFT_02511090 [Schizophyllum commune H4-8]|nr:uncharacterized protein SCHCODRAFT_02511090 [Schizophyllum commune H4-8]KAI5889732.1 hypothetical protein SCHCODRAFT_02511090 [Schizophyllum commune H4-8]
MAEFLALPDDIITSILCVSRPVDIIRLRQTCQTLNMASRERWIWAKVTPEIIAHNCMCISSSDLDQLSAQELERIATTPMKCLLAMSAAATKDTRDIQGLQPQRQTLHPSVGSLYRRLILVPGGSYLFIEGFNSIRLLRLDPARPTEIAKLQSRDDDMYKRSYFLNYRVTGGGRVLRFAIVRRAFMYPDAPQLSVYDIEPEAVGASFSLVARTRDLGSGYHQVQCHEVAFCDTRLAVCDEAGPAMLWDLEWNTRVFWQHTASLCENLAIRIIGNCIAVTSGSGDGDWAHSARLTVFTLPQVANGTSTVVDLGPTYDDRGARVYYPQHISDGENPTFYIQCAEHTDDHLRSHTIKDGEPAQILTTDRAIDYHALQACPPGPNSMTTCDDGPVFTDFLRCSGQEVQFIWPRRNYGTQLQGKLRLEYSPAGAGDHSEALSLSPLMHIDSPSKPRFDARNGLSHSIIPFDVIFLVLAFLRPIDLIQLRQTCAALYTASRQCSVWLAIALRNQDQNPMLISPNVLGKLSADELESMSIAPTKCMLAMRAVAITDSTEIQALQPKQQMTWGGVVPYGCRRLILIAGGSYLLMDSPAVGIQLLRLGRAGPELVDAIPKRRRDGGGDVIALPNLMDYCIVGDGRVLRLAISTLNPTPDTAFEVNIYDIEPEAPNATFVIIARTHDLGGILNPHNSRWCLCDTRLAVCDYGYALLWDFLQDTRMIWGHRPIQHGEMRLNIFGDRVAIMSWRNHATATRLAIYAPPAGHGPHTFCDLEPSYELTVPPGVHIHHSEHIAADGSFTFHIHRTFAVDDNLRTHTLREGRASTLTADRSIGKDVWRAYRPGLNAMVHCAGGHVSTEALREGGRQVQFIWSRPELNSELLGTVTLEYLSSRATDRCSFDPASGRMCTVKDDGSLVVLDYL